VQAMMAGQQRSSPPLIARNTVGTDGDPTAHAGTNLIAESFTVWLFHSYVYDVGSVSGGPEACEPTVELPGMFVGIWASDAAGNGLLIQLAPPGAIAPLGTFDTVSIRDATINSGFGVQAVVACGQVAVNP
jgi:hypothetical protein